MNSIYDFIECARYLIREGFVHKNRLSAVGVSAGGLLVGATINLHPHLFSAAVLKVISILIRNFIAQKDNTVRLLKLIDFYSGAIPRYMQHDVGSEIAPDNLGL